MASLAPPASLSVEPCRDTAIARYPGVDWDSAGLSVDLTFDGQAELVLRGRTDSSVAVVIVECIDGKAGRDWKYEVGPMCGSWNIHVTVHETGFGEGYFLEQCLGIETSAECAALRGLMQRLDSAKARRPETRAIRIGPADCDGFHVYWDPADKSFHVWRL